MVYYCDYISGEPTLRQDSQEFVINEMGKNLYIPTWMSLEELPNVKFVSPELQRAITDAVTNGWPQAVVEFKSNRT